MHILTFLSLLPLLFQHPAPMQSSVLTPQPATVEITSSDANSLNSLSWAQLKHRVIADEKVNADLVNDISILSRSKSCTRIDMVNQSMTWKSVTFFSEGPVIFQMGSSSIASSTLYFPNAHPDVGMYLIDTRDSKLVSNTISFASTSNPIH